MLGARESQWKFVTSNSGSVGIGVAGAEAGSLTLKEPGSKREVKFYYAALGAGKQWGVKLPKIKNVKLPSMAGSVEAFPSGGLVYMSRQFLGSELKTADISGGFCFGEVAIGLTSGVAAYAVIFGMDPTVMAAMPLNPSFLNLALDGATGYLIFGGMNYGLQFGAGGGVFVGGLYAA